MDKDSVQNSDKDVLKEMFRKAGIEWVDKDELNVSVERGYFETWFTFDEEGNLKDMGAYE